MENTPGDKTTVNQPFRILSLDGGGAKGFYTIGVLEEIEKMTGKPIHQSFDLIFGTSTGSIIAALLARGDSVQAIRSLYEKAQTATEQACVPFFPRLCTSVKISKLERM